MSLEPRNSKGSESHTLNVGSEHAELSDGEVLTWVGKGNIEMLGILAGRYERLLLGVAKGLLYGDEAGARDCVQEAWLRIIRGAQTFSGGSSAKSWITQVLVNVVRDHGRSISRRKRTHVSFVLTQQPPRTHASSGEHPTTSFEHTQTDELHSALQTLRSSDREIVLLCTCRSLTHEEAAHVLGLPIGTLKSRLYRSLKRLRVELQSNVEEKSQQVGQSDNQTASKDTSISGEVQHGS